MPITQSPPPPSPSLPATFILCLRTSVSRGWSFSLSFPYSVSPSFFMVPCAISYIPHMSETIWWFSFSNWLISLNIKPSSCIPIEANGRYSSFPMAKKPKFLTAMLHHKDLTKGHYYYLTDATCLLIDWVNYYQQTNESGKEKLLIRSNDGRIRNGTEKELATIIHYPVLTIYRIFNSYFTSPLQSKWRECLILSSVYIGKGQKCWASKSLLSSDLGGITPCSSMLNFR